MLAPFQFYPSFGIRQTSVARIITVSFDDGAVGLKTFQDILVMAMLVLPLKSLTHIELHSFVWTTKLRNVAITD